MSTLFPRQSMALASRIDCAAVTEAKMVSACFTSLLSTVESSWLPKLSSWLLPLDPAAPDESFGRWASAAPSSMHSASVVDIEPQLISGSWPSREVGGFMCRGGRLCESTPSSIISEFKVGPTV